MGQKIEEDIVMNEIQKIKIAMQISTRATARHSKPGDGMRKRVRRASKKQWGIGMENWF